MERRGEESDDRSKRGGFGGNWRSCCSSRLRTQTRHGVATASPGSIYRKSPTSPRMSFRRKRSNSSGAPSAKFPASSNRRCNSGSGCRSTAGTGAIFRLAAAASAVRSTTRSIRCTAARHSKTSRSPSRRPTWDTKARAQISATIRSCGIDFAHRGVHVTAEIAKAIVAAYYGKPAERAYFIGCSDGGREGLMSAQRYPVQISTGSPSSYRPAFNFQIQNTFYHAWNARSNSGTGRQADHRRRRSSDPAPGGAQGLPCRRWCDRRPAPLRVRSGRRALHRRSGRRLSDRRNRSRPRARSTTVRAQRTVLALTIGGPQPGSELSWAGVYVPKPGSDDIFSNVIAGGTISFLAFDPNPPKTFGLEGPRLRPRYLRAAEADARALRCHQSRPHGLLLAVAGA